MEYKTKHSKEIETRSKNRKQLKQKSDKAAFAAIKQIGR